MEKIHNNLSGLINKASEEAVSSFEEGYDISFAGENIPKLYPILLTENLQSMFTLNLCPVVFVKNNLPYTSH